MSKKATQEYIHTNHLGDEVREEIVDYAGRQVLAVGKCGSSPLNGVYREITVVPGFVLNFRKRQTPEGLDISDVEPLPENQHESLSKLLRDMGFPRQINYWEKSK